MFWSARRKTNVWCHHQTDVLLSVSMSWDGVKWKWYQHRTDVWLSVSMFWDGVKRRTRERQISAVFHGWVLFCPLCASLIFMTSKLQILTIYFYEQSNEGDWSYVCSKCLAWKPYHQPSPKCLVTLPCLGGAQTHTTALTKAWCESPTATVFSPPAERTLPGDVLGIHGSCGICTVIVEMGNLPNIGDFEDPLREFFLGELPINIVGNFAISRFCTILYSKWCIQGLKNNQKCFIPTYYVTHLIVCVPC